MFSAFLHSHLEFSNLIDELRGYVFHTITINNHIIHKFIVYKYTEVFIIDIEQLLKWG